MEKEKERTEKERLLHSGKAGQEESLAFGKSQDYPEKENLLKHQLRTLAPEERRKEMALCEIRQAVQKKTVRCTPSLPELIWIELQYISPGFWILQGMLTAALVLLLEKTSLDNGGLRDYQRWTSILAAWLGVAGCVSLGRHFSRGMAELEQSCFFNLTQLWTIKMALSGAVDILILGLASGRIAAGTAVPFVRVSVYVLVPFVLSNVCCLLFFTAIRGGRSRYGQLAMAFVTGIIAAVPASQPEEVYEGAFLWAWAFALLCGVGIYLWQLWWMYGKIRRGEMICWS